MSFLNSSSSPAAAAAPPTFLREGAGQFPVRAGLIPGDLGRAGGDVAVKGDRAGDTQTHHGQVSPKPQVPVWSWRGQSRRLGAKVSLIPAP